MPTDNKVPYGLWRSLYKPIGVLVFVLILGPIAMAFRWSGHWDAFKRFQVIVAVPASYGVMEGIDGSRSAAGIASRCRRSSRWPSESVPLRQSRWPSSTRGDCVV